MCRIISFFVVFAGFGMLRTPFWWFGTPLSGILYVCPYRPTPPTHFQTLQYRKVSFLANGESLYLHLWCGWITWHFKYWSSRLIETRNLIRHLIKHKRLEDCVICWWACSQIEQKLIRLCLHLRVCMSGRKRGASVARSSCSRPLPRQLPYIPRGDRCSSLNDQVGVQAL